ncbi:MAG: aldehyde dehydrogenase family protein [Bacteroidota bacterium]
MIEYKIYVGGEFISTGKQFEITNAWDGSVIATTYLAGKAELDKAIENALAVTGAMKKLPAYKRYAILNEIAAAIKSDRDRLAKILAQEACKPLKLAVGEIDRAVQTFIVAAEESKRLPREYISIDWTPAGENREGLVKYFPVGLIAGIAPFNFPLNLAVHKIAPAIASGNPIILKPARSTPLSVLELAKIIDRTELPKGALSILPMDRESGNQLVTDDRIKMLTFTGSPEVGWKMKQEAGKKKVTLELGGNAGVIVTDTADLDRAVARCHAGAFAYAGQVCIHVQRILVDERVFDEFVSRFVKKTETLKQGHPADPETDISAMIDEENAIRVELWIQDAVAGGAKVLYGGKRNGTFIEPTVITGTKPEMKVCSLEIFGPVVTIEKYRKFEDALHTVNNSRYGLQAGVFTNNIKEADLAFDTLEVGGLMLNDAPTYRVDHMPYGGIKDSGFGREGLKYAIFEMMEPRLLVKDIL